MGDYAVGQSVPRTEDPRLLTGGGRYVDDIDLVGACRAYLLRSPHAHATIARIDAGAAIRAPGVLAVLTAADYVAAGLGPMSCTMPLKRRDGEPMFRNPHPPLAEGRVRTVGDAVAMIVAETLAEAKDAADLIEVDYQPLPALTSTADAMNPDSPTIWDACPDNECFLFELGDKAAADAAFAQADHVIQRRMIINRVASNAIEPRAFLGDYDRHDDRYTLYSGLHRPHDMRSDLAHTFLHVPETQVRVVARDIGGSFGLRGGTYPEQILVVWASKVVGRPVRWAAERSEGFTSDYHGRDNVTDAELALDRNGIFLGMRVRTLVNLGAYVSPIGPGPAINNLGALAGVYTTPAIHVATSGVFTNTNPTCPYRGAGRPEAAYVIEQLVEIAARELGVDAVELRRRNTIPPDAMPFKTGLVFIYDCGAFEKNMDDALLMADRAGFESRRAEAKARGKLRGLGLSNTIERAGPPGQERAQVRIDPTGSVTVFAGTISHGQGHDTIYKQIVSEGLGVAPELIRIEEGDTDALAIGGGTGGSRSATLGGSAVHLATQKIVDKGKTIAAHLLEASEADVTLIDGSYAIAGTDRSVSLGEVARAAYTPQRLTPEIEPGLDESAGYVAKVANYPNGCHVCEVEIDPEIGTVEIVDYSVVDDVGTVLNPLLLKGQIHGGIAQGVGQALMEDMAFDPDSGQLLSGSFMDYTMPRADDLSYMEVATNPVPTETNPLGVKGAGEAGTVGALPATLNAIQDALGIDEIPMPATPERIWRAIRALAHEVA